MPEKSKQDAKIPDVWQNRDVLPRKFKAFTAAEGRTLRLSIPFF
ncbi:MAG: hypothetical protein ACYS6W_15280 [Planctomycetota bacterium]|jgi:hypothetical protein